MSYRKLIQANKRRYSQFAVLGSRVTYMACCDCGLVHDVQVRFRKGELVMRVRRNVSRTKARRKQMR